MENTKVKDWKLIGHSSQIADTGDYDGHYELTNGKISLLTKEDDEEAIQPIADALNDSGIKLYQDDFFEFENGIIKQECDELKKQTTQLREENERLRHFVQTFKEGVDMCSILIDQDDESQFGDMFYEKAEQLLKETDQ